MLGTVVYRHIEGWSTLDSLYFCVVTLTTIGIGDFVPETTAGVNFTLGYAISGLALVSMLATAMLDYRAAHSARNMEPAPG